IAVHAIGLSSLERAVDRLDAATAAAAARELVRLDQGAPTFADALAGEKEFSTLMLVKSLREGPAWRQALRMLYTFSTKRQILADYRASMDTVIANARKPS